MKDKKLEVVYVVIVFVALLFMVGVLFYSGIGDRGVAEERLLPVKEGGFMHDQTVNPQLTVDKSEIDWSEL